MNELIGQEKFSEFARTSQVYRATHDKVGNRLPYRYRSFISFSYGDKLIEDFGFVAITKGDRLDRKIYGKFDDITENYEVQDGQTYWGTHFINNELNLTLSTDGITARQLDDFKQWFKPGCARELILMEHPNRVILARVADTPQFSMLPFSSKEKIKVLNKDYETEVTLFKGDIDLKFIMDEPFWHAKYNIIHPFIKAGGANGIINIKDDPQQIKRLLDENYKYVEGQSGKKIYIKFKRNNIIYELSVYYKEITITEEGYYKIKCMRDDGAELLIQYPDELLGLEGGAFTIEDPDGEDSEDVKDYVKIILEDNIPHLRMIQDEVLLGEDIGAFNDYEGRVYNTEEETINGMPGLTGAHVLYYGYVNSDVTSWAQNVEISETNPQYLFYSGTAPSKPKLQFTFSPTFDNNEYVNLPNNQFVDSDIDKDKNYNFIALDDIKFYFTTPSLITGYNQAISIVRNFEDGGAFSELIILLKEKINEYYARAWAIFCAKSLKNNTTYVDSNSQVKSAFMDEFIRRMKLLIWTSGNNAHLITCSFDSKTGQSTVKFNIRQANANPENITYEQIFSIAPIFIEENAGDMVKSDYLIIDGRNYPSSEGYITKKECHLITTNFIASNPLTGLLISFQNMYY